MKLNHITEANLAPRFKGLSSNEVVTKFFQLKHVEYSPSGEKIHKFVIKPEFIVTYKHDTDDEQVYEIEYFYGQWTEQYNEVDPSKFTVYAKQLIHTP